MAKILAKIPVKDEEKIVSSLEWPPERPKIKRDSVANEFNARNTVQNAPDSPLWPKPLPEEKTNNSYILYECSNKLCGGWSNRLYGILATYFLAIIYDRTLIINIDRPCPLENYLSPRDIKWNAKKPKTWSDVNFNGIKGESLNKDQVKRMDEILKNKDNKVVNIFTAQTGYVALFAKVKYFRNILLKKGFTENQLDTLNFMTMPLRYQIYDVLFKLKPYLQERKDNFLATLNKKPLICAHVRTGGGRTIPGDSARGRTSGTHKIWEFFQEMLKLDKFKDAKVFLATDTDTVREDFKRKFPNIGVEVPGNIVHVDRWSAQKNTFGGKKSAACEGTNKVLLDFEIMSECDLLVITWRSGFSTFPALRNRHRNEIFVWRCENNNCWIEPVRVFQSDTIKFVETVLKESSYYNCVDLSNC